MNCPECGRECPDDRNFCLYCNAFLGGQNNPLFSKADKKIKADETDNASVLLKIISFLLPVVGFVLFFTVKDKKPASADSYKIAAIAGTCISAFASLIYYCIAGSADSLLFF